ncbi:MAG: D-aminoacylase [Deltaproteobacteria bacterium]|nr:D-aminoacylase [Deltaproteobacteria bacterium]
MRCETVIRGGDVFDGSGAPAFRATIGIDGGRIVAIACDGDAAALEGATVLDATGLAVAPGFIDLHSHSDWILPQADHGEILAPLLEQGVTTIITGNCGFSPAPVEPLGARLLDEGSELVRDRPLAFEWRTHREFLDRLASAPLALNVAHLAGHGSIRLAVMGDRFVPAGADDVSAMASWVREAMEAGCIGLSTGLGYAPGMFATPDELAALGRVVAEYGGLFTSHVRAYSWISPFFSLNPLGWRAHNLRAIDEILAVGRGAGARVQISHLIFVGRATWRTQRDAIAAVERARDDGLDVAFDTFPYTAGNTTIRVVYPPWAQHDLPQNLSSAFVRARLRAELRVLRRLIGIDVSDIQLLHAVDPTFEGLEGWRFDEIGRLLGRDPIDAYFDVTRASAAKARVMLFQYSGSAEDEHALRDTLAHPLNAIETDTILTSSGHHNPASFGTFPRFLGRYSRDLGLVPLATAIHKATGLPAARAGLTQRGLVREGCAADLVVFDPATIAGPADFDAPTARPCGIRDVLLNGVAVVAAGRCTSARPGLLLRRG